LWLASPGGLGGREAKRSFSTPTTFGGGFKKVPNQQGRGRMQGYKKLKGVLLIKLSIICPFGAGFARGFRGRCPTPITKNSQLLFFQKLI
jgi:hypothetical protein